VNEVEGTGGVLRAEGGYRLAVVNVEGELSSSAHLVLYPHSFLAYYVRDGQSHVVAANAVLATSPRTGAPVWAVTGAAEGVTYSSVLFTPGPITVKAAFSLPLEVSDFTVLVPSALSGRAQIVAKP
jgi:hypothetical protein